MLLEEFVHYQLNCTKLKVETKRNNVEELNIIVSEEMNYSKHADITREGIRTSFVCEQCSRMKAQRLFQ